MTTSTLPLNERKRIADARYEVRPYGRWFVVCDHDGTWLSTHERMWQAAADALQRADRDDAWTDDDKWAAYLAKWEV